MFQLLDMLGCELFLRVDLLWFKPKENVLCNATLRIRYMFKIDVNFLVNGIYALL